jgi:hypothetical protein
VKSFLSIDAIVTSFRSVKSVVYCRINFAFLYCILTGKSQSQRHKDFHSGTFLVKGSVQYSEFIYIIKFIRLCPKYTQYTFICNLIILYLCLIYIYLCCINHLISYAYQFIYNLHTAGVAGSNPAAPTNKTAGPDHRSGPAVFGCLRNYCIYYSRSYL